MATDRELENLRKARVWAMDVECDGGTIPREIADLLDADRPLTAAEIRIVLAWYEDTAPGWY